MRYKNLVVFSVFMLMASAATAEDSGALSCSKRPDNDNKARKLAGTLFGDAEKAFDDGRYLKSLSQFLCSMTMVEHPNTVINIEKTLTKFKDKADALPLLYHYIETMPGGELTDHISTIAKEIEKDAAQKKETPVCDCPKVEPVVCPEPKTCEMVEAKARSANRILSITGWTDVGIGAVAFVTAIVLQGLAGSQKNRAQNATTYNDFLDAKDKNHSFQIGATTMFVTSALLAGTGLIHLFLLSRENNAVASDKPATKQQKPEEKPSVSVIPGPAYLGLEGTF
jgi:hypothetical protein